MVVKGAWEEKMKILEGWKVKIEDIGPLAVCTKGGSRKIEVELDGVRMMLPTRFCQVAERRRTRDVEIGV